MPTTLPPIHRTGRRPSNTPWVMLNDMGGEDRGQFAVGGAVIVMTAGATLLIGDAVYISGPGQCNKSTVAANGLLRCGIVVGGVPRSVESEETLEVLQRIDSVTSPFGDVGLTAGIVNDPVLVCFAGLCYAVADAAITAGTQVAPSTTTAGRVRPATAYGIAAGATAVTSVAANGTADITGDGTSAIFGQAFDTASGNGDIIRVLVNV